MFFYVYFISSRHFYRRLVERIFYMLFIYFFCKSQSPSIKRAAVVQLVKKCLFLVAFPSFENHRTPSPLMSACLNISTLEFYSSDSQNGTTGLPNGRIVQVNKKIIKKHLTFFEVRKLTWKSRPWAYLRTVCTTFEKYVNFRSTTELCITVKTWWVVLKEGGSLKKTRRYPNVAFSIELVPRFVFLLTSVQWNALLLQALT